MPDEADTVMEFRNSLPPEQHLRMACLELGMVLGGQDKNAADVVAMAKRFAEFVERGY